MITNKDSIEKTAVGNCCFVCHLDGPDGPSCPSLGFESMFGKSLVRDGGVGGLSSLSWSVDFAFAFRASISAAYRCRFSITSVTSA